MAKAFSWSYSKLKNYTSCPKRHYHVDIAKDAREEESEALVWGNQVHKAMADRISKGVELDNGMQVYERWAAPLAELTREGKGRVLVEQKLAITKDLGPCPWFSGEAWFRAIGDVIWINGPSAMIGDWKTGKVIEDSVQLALAAACVFAHYKDVQTVGSVFYWLKEGVTSREDFTRSDIPKIWAAVWPRIEELRNAHETETYPAKPSRLCRRYCPVKQCKFHGESHGD